MTVATETNWLTRNEAARRAGVHYNVIREWERKGHIEWRKDGAAQNSEVMIELSSLDKHLSTRQTPGRLTEGDTREKVAALEAENRELRSSLAKSETERREMLERILKIAEA